MLTKGRGARRNSTGVFERRMGLATSLIDPALGWGTCISIDRATIDHIIPKVKGGTHTYDNLQLLCRNCNNVKYIN